MVLTKTRVEVLFQGRVEAFEGFQERHWKEFSFIFWRNRNRYWSEKSKFNVPLDYVRPKSRSHTYMRRVPELTISQAIPQRVRAMPSHQSWRCLTTHPTASGPSFIAPLSVFPDIIVYKNSLSKDARIMNLARKRSRCRHNYLEKNWKNYLLFQIWF